MSAPPPPTEAPLLSMRGVSKRFGNVPALSNVDFEVRRGEVHAVCGENGAGKSTLMKVLSGEHRPDEGSLHWRGAPLPPAGPQAARAKGIVMIHQELNLVPHLTVAENIWLAREPRRAGFVDRARQRAGARACLERLGAGIDPDARVASLSIAQRQRVEIAKALSMNAELLIMDEPTSSLGAADASTLQELILELKRAGVAIVYISHRLEELACIADRVTVLRDGRCITTRPWAATSIDEIVALMVGRALDDKFPPRTRRPSGDVLLRVQGLRRARSFGPVDFELRRGEILGFAGLIGAGRTEVARAVFGADPVEGGSVALAGRRLHIRTPLDAIREGIAYVSEDRKAHGLALRMSVSHNITLANLAAVSGRAGFIRFGQERAVARRYIDALGIRTPSPDQAARLLSGGNQQKVVIAKWLFRDARVIFFDEPTRGIDVGAKYAIYELMDRLAAQGIGVVLISSELPEILGLTDRVAVFRQGRLVRMLDTRATSQEEIMVHASLGPAAREPAAPSNPQPVAA